MGKNTLRRGFTIVELLIVIVVIAILAAIALVSYQGITDRAKEGVLKSDLSTAAKQLAAEQIDTGNYPVTEAAANGGQGLKKSSGNTFAYIYNANARSYCLTGTSGTFSYLVSSDNMTVRAGACSGTQITSMDTGYNHACAVGPAAVWCWGQNGNGQLGDGSYGDSLAPRPINTAGALANKSITAVDAGWLHTCAVASGQAFCWGTNGQGQLGNGNYTQNNTAVAVSTSGVLAGKTVTAISAGSEHSCAIADGQAYCWGENGNGQLGNNNGGVYQSNTPVAVYTGGVLSGKTVTAISAGKDYTCAVASAQAYCWGENSVSGGKLGNGGSSDTYAPVAVSVSGVLAGRTVTSISAGNYHTCAVADGRAFCWGTNNGNGMLGDGLNASSSVPVAVTTSGVLSGKTVTAITAGQHNSCAVANAGAFCWGNNYDGTIGDGIGSGYYTTPASVLTSGILSGQSVTAISSSANGAHACAVAATVYCWGYSYYGALGNGTSTTQSNAPALVVFP